MASAAEQLAANMNFGALAKATELKKRIWFTLGALVIYRLGTYIPIPGIDTSIFATIYQNQAQGGVLDIFNAFSGGALERMTIFALNIMPYISASIIMQLLTAVSPQIEALKKEGESGRKKINQYTRYGTVVLAAVQAFGIAKGLEATVGTGGSAVIEPGLFFELSTVITLTGGTIFLMWLGEQITQRGVGNGISLIIFSGIVANLPIALAQAFSLGQTNALAILVPIMAVAVIAFIVYVERAHRRIIVQYPKRQVGNKMFGGEASHLPMKLNVAGVIPPIFASSLLLMPLTAAGFSGGTGPEWLSWVTANLGRGSPAYLLLFTALIVFFAFFYTSIVFNPEDTADNLKKHGGFIPGIRPGKNTATYLEFVLNRLTVVGASYLALVCLLPELVSAQFSVVTFYFGGTSLLIIVSVTMDTVGQIHSHLLAHQYEGLIKKSKLKGRRG
ncbi:preprotein translocase subunit SecY [Pelagibius sp. Alg239-R121]|uniref:preprotein translocase subunit SecY n=1 Tax=Pelagibius sp. Alg239-R121 TaxID=2993448 RepID=UPI0024A77D60|nr:preprotein translocase subunit SecY [Pelagibius sp. Alg239-R121]